MDTIKLKDILRNGLQAVKDKKLGYHIVSPFAIIGCWYNYAARPCFGFSNHGGYRCIIGHSLTKKQCAAFEGETVVNLYDEGRIGLDHPDIVFELQHLHDVACNRRDGRIEFEARLNELAHQFEVTL